MRSTFFVALAASAFFTGTAMAGDPPPPPGMDAPQQAGNPADDMALLLGLSPEQRPALEDFLRATAPPPPPHGDGGDHGRGDEGGDGDGGGGDDRHGPPNHARMQARMEAIQHFRASLNPDQQLRFDALERMRRGMGPRHRWGGPPPQE